MIKTDSADAPLPTRGVEAASDRAGIDPAIWIVAAAVLALLAKLYIAYTTFGTDDVLSFFQFARALTAHGLQWTYANLPNFNHPPLTAYFLRGIYYLDQYPSLKQSHLFPFLLRLPGIVADFVVVLVLLILKRRKTPLLIPTWALVLLALSPASIMISGFHGNTDPVMVMFLVLAAAMFFFDRPIASGLFLALACHVYQRYFRPFALPDSALLLDEREKNGSIFGGTGPDFARALCPATVWISAIVF